MPTSEMAWPRLEGPSCSAEQGSSRSEGGRHVPGGAVPPRGSCLRRPCRDIWASFRVNVSTTGVELHENASQKSGGLRTRSKPKLSGAPPPSVASNGIQKALIRCVHAAWASYSVIARVPPIFLVVVGFTVHRFSAARGDRSLRFLAAISISSFSYILVERGILPRVFTSIQSTG